MPAVDPGSGRTADRNNPQAQAYARHMLGLLVQHGLISSIAAASSHYGGDLTATWRALSGLTGQPRTYPGATGPGYPTTPEPASMRGAPGPVIRAGASFPAQPVNLPNVGSTVGALDPLEVLLRLAGGHR